MGGGGGVGPGVPDKYFCQEVEEIICWEGFSNYTKNFRVCLIPRVGHVTTHGLYSL
jgi:hypothetical protein